MAFVTKTLDGTAHEEILVVGGADHDIVLNNVEVYNPGLNIWKKLKSQKLPSKYSLRPRP